MIFKIITVSILSISTNLILLWYYFSIGFIVLGKSAMKHVRAEK